MRLEFDWVKLLACAWLHSEGLCYRTTILIIVAATQIVNPIKKCQCWVRKTCDKTNIISSRSATNHPDSAGQFTNYYSSHTLLIAPPLQMHPIETTLLLLACVVSSISSLFESHY